jgi:hypothetical protein
MHTSLQEFLAVSAKATTPRFDIYAGIHKGVRLLLGDILARAGRVPSDDPAALRDLARSVEHLAGICSAHLEHENAFIHPALEQAQPGTSRRIAAEHVDHERDIETLRRQARALVDSAPSDRAAACRALYLALGLFAAHNLAHMHLEETEHNAVLWAHYSDGEIAAIQAQLIAHLSPAQMFDAMRWMIPAIAPAERLGLLGEMRANAPAPVFDAVLSLAREVLDDGGWAALARGLGVPVTAGLAA